MINCEYVDLDGQKQTYDLDAVVDIVRGKSQKKSDWVALIVFDPASSKFIELRDSPPDPRGNSKDEAEEIDESYLLSHFQLGQLDISSIRGNPTGWVFVDLNK